MEEIKNYVLEKKLKVNAEQFYNYFTEGNWIDSKGNQVRSWKQKILTWNGYITPKKEEKPEINQRKYADVDFNNCYANMEYKGSDNK